MSRLDLAIVDDDLSTLVTDLNGLADNYSATIGNAVYDLNLGSPTKRRQVLTQEGVPGGLSVVADDDKVAFSFQLLVRHTSFDGAIAALQAIVAQLQRTDRYLRYRADNATSYRFIRFDPFDVPDYLDDDAAGLEKGDAYRSAAGGFQVWATFSSLRQPYYLGPKVSGTPTALTTKVGDREIAVTSAGNAPGPAVVIVTPDASAKTVQARIGRRAKGNLTEFATLYSFEVEGATLGTDTTATADTTESPGGGGNTRATTSFATQDTLARRWKKAITPADASALGPGEYRAYCLLRFGNTSIFGVQLRWGLENTDPSDWSNDEVTLDLSAGQGTADWCAVDLGVVNYDPAAGTLVLEGWAERTSGSGSLFWGQVFLLPADEQVIVVSMPGIRMGSTGYETWRGDRLVTPTSPGGLTGGLANGEITELNAVGEAAGTPPVAGLAWPAAHHKIVFKYDLYSGPPSASITVQYRVRDVTDGDYLDSAGNSLTRSRTKTATGITEYTDTIEFDSEAGDLYEPQIAVTATSGAIYAAVKRIYHYWTRTAASPNRIVIDGLQRKAYLDNGSGVFLLPVIIQGPWPEQPGGDAVWVFDFGEVPSSGYDDVDSREPLVKNDIARTYTTQVDHYPGFSTA